MYRRLLILLEITALKDVLPAAEWDPICMQMAGLAVVMMVTSAAACMGVHTFGRLMAILGTGLRVTPTAFGVASLVAMSNPIIAIFSVLLIPVCAALHISALIYLEHSSMRLLACGALISYAIARR